MGAGSTMSDTTFGDIRWSHRSVLRVVGCRGGRWKGGGRVCLTMILFLLFILLDPGHHPGQPSEMMFAGAVPSSSSETDSREDEKICFNVFDISNGTIIKASESVKRGGRFIGGSTAESRWDCQRTCCSTPDCNIAVFQEIKDKDCYLFDCGTPQNFKCVFSVHSNYVAMGMMVARADLEKTRIHEQARHEMDLNIMKHKNGGGKDNDGSEDRPSRSDWEQPYRGGGGRDRSGSRDSSMERGGGDDGDGGSRRTSSTDRGDERGGREDNMRRMDSRESLDDRRGYDKKKFSSTTRNNNFTSNGHGNGNFGNMGNLADQQKSSAIGISNGNPESLEDCLNDLNSTTNTTTTNSNIGE